jgi:hypothetical protein
MTYINGFTGINYQKQIGQILRIYYKSINKIYEMPDFYGGDQKNDGWVVEDSLFYQIYAPTRLKDSLKKEIQDKFKEDLEGLLKIVYEEKKWNGIVKEFIFIVNTFDNDLPNDSERYFDNTVEELKKKYLCDFKYQLKNSDYIKDLLYKVEETHTLEQMASSLHFMHMVDHNAITETVITDLLINISGNISEKYIINKTAKKYDRISTPKKIEINDLNEIKDEINNILYNLDVVEKAINAINQDILNENKFGRVKDFIVDKYKEFSVSYRGVELFDKIVEETIEHTNKRWDLHSPVKFLILYIFDKCDIFEKE